MFRDIINEEIKAMFKKRKMIIQKKIVKEKKMHIKSMKFNFIELIHLKEIIVRVAFLRSMYVVACLTMNMSIENIKIKALFDSDAEINYMLKNQRTRHNYLFVKKLISL